MNTVWIGDREVAAENLKREVVNDIDWLEELLKDIRTEIEPDQLPDD